MFGAGPRALPGQAVLADLLNEAYVKIQQLLEKESNAEVASELQPLQTKITTLLEEIEDYHGDEHGLKQMQGRVNEIDNARVNGVFGYKEGQPAPAGQTVLMNILEACYAQV